MENTFLALSNIYNFIDYDRKPAMTISTHLLSQFVHIHSLLRNFTENDQDPKPTFHDLYLFLVQEEDVFGPRKFRRLVEAVTTVVIEYVLTKLRSNSTQKGILCLTYFQRSCQRYLNVAIRMLINATFALAHLTKRTYSIIETYVNNLNSLLVIHSKTDKNGQFTSELNLLQSLFSGIYFYFTQKLTKAKSIFAEMVSTLTLRIHEQKSKKKTMSLLTIHYFILATYYISLAYKALGNNDISAYNLTQSYQFAQEYLPQNTHFIQKCKQGTQLCNKAVVKLSRIQNKIQRIKSLHSFHNLSKDLNLQKLTKEHSKLKFQRQQLKKTKINKQIQVPTLALQKQLKNLFTLDEKAGGKLKHRTLRVINKQAEEKMHKIQTFKEEIQNFEKGKLCIDQHYKLDQQQQQIVDIEQKKQALKQEIRSKMWSVVSSLKPTRKIQSYILGFKTAIEYQSTNRFYRMLYSAVGVMGHLTILRYIRRYKSKLQRISIKTLEIKGYRHQMEFLVHKETNRRYIKVYNVVSGGAVDDKLEVDEQTFNSLCGGRPLNYHFNIIGNKLCGFKQYFQSLDQRLRLQVCLFVFKLKQRMQRKRQELSYSKHHLSVTFGQKRSQLSYVLFVVSKKLAKYTYSHEVQRIDSQLYYNPDYNISIRTTLYNDSFMIGIYDINALIVDSLLKAKKKHQKLVLGLQRMLRQKLAIRAANRLRETTKVTTAKINNTLFTLVLTANSSIFFVQHLEKMHPLQILKGVDYGNLAFINKLRNELQSTEDCLRQLAIIKKYHRLKQFGQRMVSRSKEFTLSTNFSTKFKKSLCFAKVMKQILYKGKFVETKAMYMLTIKDFEVCPRPYLLRVFNLESRSLYSFDFEKIVFMSQKIFLQSNLLRINTLIDIQGYKLGSVLPEGLKLMVKNKRMNSKSTVLSNYSFKHQSLEQVIRENPSRSRVSYHVQTRESLIVNRNKKNSINYKMRHKSALKQKDIMLIKKWIEDCKQNELISESSESSES